jgi:RNA polymerase sigma factor (sigma-70 family)
MASRSFDDSVLPHLDAAFNYARWLTRSDADAEDVVQDACVRAVRFFPSLRDNDARAWFLTIVRNAWYSRVARRTPEAHSIHISELTDEPSDSALDPEALLSQRDTLEHVRKALTELPLDFREVIVLRELEGFSYKEIAVVINAPIGTVMSRLARARERLSAVLQQPPVEMETAQ